MFQIFYENLYKFEMNLMYLEYPKPFLKKCNQ